MAITAQEMLNAQSLWDSKFSAFVTKVTTKYTALTAQATAFEALAATTTANKTAILDALAGEGLTPPAPWEPDGVVFEGDEGVSGWMENTNTYPAQYGVLSAVPYTNIGSAGDRLYYVRDGYNLAGGGADVYNADTRNTYVVDAGTTDIAEDGHTDLDLRTTITDIAALANATGYRVFVGTITVRNDAQWNATKEGYRTAYNAWLIANAAALDITVIDFASVITLADTFNNRHVSNTGAGKKAAKVQLTFATA